MECQTSSLTHNDSYVVLHALDYYCKCLLKCVCVCVCGQVSNYLSAVQYLHVHVPTYSTEHTGAITLNWHGG